MKRKFWHWRSSEPTSHGYFRMRVGQANGDGCWITNLDFSAYGLVNTRRLLGAGNSGQNPGVKPVLPQASLCWKTLI